MPSQSTTNGNVFVRSKRTHEIDIRRANEFTPRPTLSTPLKDRTLHYIGSDRKVVCRCSNPKRHYEKTFAVAAESTHLNASLVLYMHHQDITSCTIADFKKFSERRKAQWAKQGVDADRFHYATEGKDVVCRCGKSGSHHDFGKPRNPEIIEQCAQFFIAHGEVVRVQKEQWKRVVGGTPPPAYEAGGRSGGHTSPDRHDIPSQVWVKARPSVLTPSYATSPALSTPLGTVVPPTLSTSRTVRAKMPAAKQEYVYPSCRSSTSTYWSQIQREAGGLDEDFVIPNSEPVSQMDSLADDIETMTIRELPGTLRSPPAPISSGAASIPLLRADVFNPIAELPAQRLGAVELSAQRSPVELPTQPPRMRDTATLKVLEGRNWDTASELEANKRPSSSGKSISTRRSVGMSSLFSQLLEEVSSSLPDQKEFFFSHAILTSRKNPAPAGNCQLCEKPYHDERKRTIMLPDCGCFFHERCLLGNLRALDQEFGRCPICRQIICVRTLADCINTDRQAIFGSQFTALPSSVLVSFPHRDEAVRCTSEEEVAIALSRLMKDYVDVHTEELFRLWEDNRAEPDWYAKVVRPVVQLFKGWNPTVCSRFFPRSDIYLKLIAWAELVRSMNTTRVTTRLMHGEHVLFPQLGQLHAKFAMCRSRYESEKRDGKGSVDCDRIALDAARLAMETHMP